MRGITYALRLVEDRFHAAASLPLPASNRVVYVHSGEVVIESFAGSPRVSADAAWYGGDDCVVRSGSDTARIARYELMPMTGAPVPAGGGGLTSTLLLEHAIDLDPAGPYLMRCDRVDFSPGGIAWPHRHKGGGIRWLIGGELEVTVGDEPPRVMHVGDPWFESGAEAVCAKASPYSPTSFIRVSILPRSIRGMSSIMYVDPADAQRGAPRRYRVFVDEPIELPS